MALLLLSLWLGAAEPVNRLIDFSQYHFGAVPSEFEYDATGPHGPVLTAGRPFWRTFVDLFAPSPKFVLIQASTLAQPDHYPIALLRDFRADDVRVGVHLRLMGGEQRTAAGLLWRARDKSNYYAVLASARTRQLSVVAMKDGRPRELAAAPVPVEVEFERREPSPTRGWYLLEVAARGDRHTIWFQGQKLLEVKDGTFPQPGRVGLITHAETVAVFDDFSVQTTAQPGTGGVRSASGHPANPAKHAPRPD